ncbi:U32 family peptidase [candidate division KSB1 bacterium]|nr:U32 family peptidase [candidate division KSB1 bacterium]
MSPAGSYESLMAAIKAGTNAVYFGVGKLNMRARAAKNFQTEDLKKISRICSRNHVRCYLTLNTILYDDEIAEMQSICEAATDAGISAVIASDIAAINYARKIGLEVHISTQANVSNLESVKFYAGYADVIVLARELTIEQVKSICSEIKRQEIRGPGGNPLQVELFVHGALCVSISGKCYMSESLTGHSANRGNCLQTCRRSYKVIDDVTGDELAIDNEYVMSPKDLCTIGFIDQLIESGATVFKIEGRGRREDYVYRVTRAYREAIDSYFTGTFSKEKAKQWEAELSKVFNRGFWHGGYYMGRHIDDWSKSYGSRATKQKVYAGYVKNYFPKAGIAEFVIENGEVKTGDKLMVTGVTTGFVETTADSIFVNDVPADLAVKGDFATIPVTEKVRRNDKLYLIIDRVDFQK